MHSRGAGFEHGERAGEAQAAVARRDRSADGAADNVLDIGERRDGANSLSTATCTGHPACQARGHTRACERSQPWLTFRLDLTRASYQLWLLLGEAQSKGLREQIRRLRLQQRDICWRECVHERFRGRRSDGDKRKRDLVLALSLSDEPTPTERIKLLTPEIAAHYATKSDKTLTRDIRELIAMELLEATEQGLLARKDIMRAFTARQAVGAPVVSR